MEEQQQLEDGKEEEAIYHLIEASKAGNKEATELLAKHLEKGEGITTANRDEVEWCVRTPESEKRLKHAINELFVALKKEGKEIVTAEEIGDALQKAKDKLKDLTSGSSSGSLQSDEERREDLGLMSLLTNAMSVGGKDEFTVNEFMDTAMSYAQGDVPELVTVLNKEDMEKYNKASLIEKIHKFPHQSVESLKHYILFNISMRGSSWVKTLIPTAQIQTLLLLYIYNQLTAEILWFTVPLVIFYISMMGLIVFSLQMFYGREALKQLRSVSELMKKLDPLIDEQEAETKFIWKSITPYISFFVSLIITVAVFPLCDKAWIPCSELSLIALFFTVSALRGLRDEYDELAMYTIGLKVLTTVLYSLEDVKGLWILCRPLITIPLPYTLEIHISVPSALHIVILAMLIVMAGRHSWRGIYKVLIPHLVCLLWWQMFSELFQHTTWRSIARTSVGWIIIITMLPLIFLYIVGVFLVSFLQWFGTLTLAMKLAVTAIAIGLSSVVILYSNIRLPTDVRQKRKFLLGGVAVVVLFLLGPILYVNYVPAVGSFGVPLTWERYDGLCGPKAKEHHNEASLQASCSEFSGETVLWSGRVSFVRVAAVENRFRSFVMAMPSFLRPTLRCLLGQEGESATDSSSSSGWIFKRRSTGDCNLKSFDRYTFQMGVVMMSDDNKTLTVKIKITHQYYHTMVTLKPSSQVTFKGRLESGLGLNTVSLSMRSLYINGTRVKPRVGVQREDVYAGLKQAGRYSVQFFLSPLVNQRGEEENDEDE